MLTTLTELLGDILEFKQESYCDNGYHNSHIQMILHTDLIYCISKIVWVMSLNQKSNYNRKATDVNKKFFMWTIWYAILLNYRVSEICLNGTAKI